MRHDVVFVWECQFFEVNEQAMKSFDTVATQLQSERHFGVVHHPALTNGPNGSENSEHAEHA